MTNILECVPGIYVSDALRTLPDAETASESTMRAEIDVPGIGRVLITANRHRTKKGKFSRYFWTAETAVQKKDITGGRDACADRLGRGGIDADVDPTMRAAVAGWRGFGSKLAFAGSACLVSNHDLASWTSYSFDAVSSCG
jgi:hypothetical protein